MPKKPLELPPALVTRAANHGRMVGSPDMPRTKRSSEEVAAEKVAKERNRAAAAAKQAEAIAQVTAIEEEAGEEQGLFASQPSEYATKLTVNAEQPEPTLKLKLNLSRLRQRTSNVVEDTLEAAGGSGSECSLLFICMSLADSKPPEHHIETALTTGTLLQQQSFAIQPGLINETDVENGQDADYSPNSEDGESEVDMSQEEGASDEDCFEAVSGWIQKQKKRHASKKKVPSRAGRATVEAVKNGTIAGSGTLVLSRPVGKRKQCDDTSAVQP
ncbi:hypothetical protein BD414DRAFT_510108 [Trametes punicea]|nr:hypothetical protein BD414DRAFT_510108 [Trametes punicea]